MGLVTTVKRQFIEGQKMIRAPRHDDLPEQVRVYDDEAQYAHMNGISTATLAEELTKDDPFFREFNAVDNLELTKAASVVNREMYSNPEYLKKILKE